jgi:hypothetical protein
MGNRLFRATARHRASEGLVEVDLRRGERRTGDDRRRRGRGGRRWSDRALVTAAITLAWSGVGPRLQSLDRRAARSVPSSAATAGVPLLNPPTGALPGETGAVLAAALPASTGSGAAEGATTDVELDLPDLVPFEEKKEGRIGSYTLGTWPYESGSAPSAAYAPPKGFIEVTRENRSRRISEHFTLGDFLTKDQSDVWPKYVALDRRLVEKLELVIEELKARGHPVEHMAVMSGFRTPRYNASGNTRGRSSISRHMYGDAADVYVDNDRDGNMDDLDGDGRVDVRDAEIVARAAEAVEARHARVVGGIGVYAATSAHGPFVHIDTRGRRARWRGTGAG